MRSRSERKMGALSHEMSDCEYRRALNREVNECY